MARPSRRVLWHPAPRQASPAGSSKPLAATAAGAAPVAAAPGGSSSSSDGTFRRRELLAIGCSTGGPKALGVLLRGLPADFPAPIVIVQHMPTGFTRMLAEQLDAECSLTVREVEGPTVASAAKCGSPGDHHIRLINTNGSIVLDDGPEENNCRPAVDVLFRSVAETYGRRAVGVILTGMGDDGKRGAEAMAAKGAHIIAQDQATSVVWGMAGAVVRAGVASSVLPIDQIAEETLMNFRPKQTAVAS
ncbi:MAG: CheB methylesterase domain-containing protein [Acidimicrobiales bacterium]